jgi:predicted RNase H-like nuclease (RuvC/YqgF family)
MFMSTSYDRYIWPWEEDSTIGYNLLSALEATLMNFKIIQDHSDIQPTEEFDERWRMRVSSKEMMLHASVIKELQTKIESMQEIIDNQYDDIAEFKKEMRDAMDGLWSDVREMNYAKDIDRLSELYDDIEDQVGAIGHECTTLEERIDCHDKDISTLADEVADLTLLK